MKEKEETHRKYTYTTIRQWVIMISRICVGIWMLFHGSIWQALFIILGGILMGPQVQLKFPGIKGYLLDCVALILPVSVTAAHPFCLKQKKIYQNWKVQSNGSAKVPIGQTTNGKIGLLISV